MSFDGLATDALLLVMQHCDAQSLLALARCGRHTHAAALKPTAWRALSSRPVLLPFAVPFDFSESTESAWTRCCRCMPRSSPPVAPPLPPLSQRVSDSLQRRPLPSVGFRLSTTRAHRATRSVTFSTSAAALCLVGAGRKWRRHSLPVRSAAHACAV